MQLFGLELQAGSKFGLQEHSWRCCASQSSGTHDTEGMQGCRGRGEQGTEIPLLSPPCIQGCTSSAAQTPRWARRAHRALPCSQHLSFALLTQLLKCFGFKAGLCRTHNTWFPSPGQPVAQKYTFFHLCGLFPAFLSFPLFSLH